MLVTPSNANLSIMDIDIKDKDDQHMVKARARDDGLEPAIKKLKRVYTNVEMVLKQTTEMIMVLVGVATLRGGAPPNPLECQLATKLYEKMTTLVTILAPQDLVSNDILQSLIQQLAVPQPHPTSLPLAKIVSIQPRSSCAVSTTSMPSLSLVPSSTTGVSKAPTHATTLSPSPLPSPTTPISLPIASAPLVSITSSSQTFELQVLSLKAKTTSVNVSATSKAAPPIPKIVAPMPSILLEKTKALEDVQTSSTNLEKSVSPFVSLSLISNTNTNFIVATSITPTNILKSGGQISPMKWQALPSTDAQPTTTMMTTMKTIFINDKKKSQAPKTMEKEQRLKNSVNNELPPIVLDSQQIHKQLALAVHLLLKPHITTPRLEKSSLKYLNIPIPCSICKIVVNTTINVLVCDGCESLFHLQCLQLSSTQSIFKNDWYCPKCVIINVGRPQAPKYGTLRRGPVGALGPKNSWSMEVRCGSEYSKDHTPLKLLLQSKKKEGDAIPIEPTLQYLKLISIPTLKL